MFEEQFEFLRSVLFELSRSDFWFAVFLIIAFFIVWLCLRGLRTWYWKQNHILDKLNDIEDLLERIMELQLRQSRRHEGAAPILETLFENRENTGKTAAQKGDTPDIKDKENEETLPAREPSVKPKDGPLTGKEKLNGDFFKSTGSASDDS